ncbi:MAG: hypothetical protein M1327_07270 [Candidatus Thermoplasmatota archaeon]|nr:hypothetical protein [Candidatus Thermoplasmatota archaeon]
MSLLLVSGTRSLYTRAGCIRTGLEYHYNIRREGITSQGPSQLYSVNKVLNRARSAAWMLDLYSREAYRFERNLSEMTTLLDAIWFKRENWPMKLYQIADKEKRIAYLIVFKRGNDNRTLTLMEMAGSKSAIVDLLPFVMNEMDADDINLRVHPADTDMVQILDSMGYNHTIGPVQGTVRIIDPSNLIKELGEMITERGWNCSAQSCEDMKLLCRSSLQSIGANTPAEITNAFFGICEDCSSIPLMFTDDLNFI